ncbi:hypothetical protein DN752_01435 [Echinicola strongylocentroti]|uniref:Cell wall anchor protein n=1 Tax=Echinicola strongylocentroti TaxID=1795355 RepID=A0A2Z4IDF7_9BACT|nr:hypothetical protein [Echinicola strongylocentroti]AWW28899.1 hypothetical protein DN752_01435 [Echinicola strongylocentroti]
MKAAIIVFIVLSLTSAGMSLGQTNTFPSSGNVGIGTTAPQAKLDVNGGISLSGYNAISSVNYFHNSLQLLSSSHSAIVYNPGKSTELMFGFHSNGNFYWGTGRNAGNSYSMILNKYGRLNIQGGMSIKGYNPVSSVHGFRNSLELVSADHSAIVYNPGESTELMFGFHSNGNFYWGTGRKAENKYGMFLSAKAGDLGIKGRLTANEVNVKKGGWADYVFLPDYPLMPLMDLETYVKEQGHLPNIPTEAEIKEKGINLGEMDVKLLEKIEELTLYLIQQQKVNQEQAKYIAEQQQRIEALERKASQNKE